MVNVAGSGWGLGGKSALGLRGKFWFGLEIAGRRGGVEGYFVCLAEPGQGVPNAIVSITLHWRGILRRVTPQRCKKGCVALLKRYLHAHHFVTPLSAGRQHPQKGQSPIRREQNSWQSNIFWDSQKTNTYKSEKVLWAHRQNNFMGHPPPIYRAIQDERGRRVR